MILRKNKKGFTPTPKYSACKREDGWRKTQEANNFNAQSMRLRAKGFTFVELLIAILIFSLMMIAVAGIFSSSFGGYRSARIIQKDLEDAQFVMNQMAKILRSSSIISSSGNSQLTVYDYSTQKCYNYKFEENKIKASSYAEDIKGKKIENFCASGFSNFNSLAAFFVQGKFYPISSDKTSGRLGKVTISMKICSNFDCTGDKVNIQSSVSLRDYYNAGI